MARKKKPVDDTPIGDPAYVRRIDPLWMPGRVPPCFWHDETHRRDYLLWSARRLGFRTMEDLYRLELTACYERNYGGGLYNYWGLSALAAVEDCFPQYDWKPWLFPAVPNGFWGLRANRRAYLAWLGKELAFRRPEDWYRIQRDDLASRHGNGLLQGYSSFRDLLREFLPQLDWDRVDVHRLIRGKEVLAWADAYHARHGTWPTCRSGAIPGTGETWRGINHCLQSGYHGLPGGTSLAKFLEEHRGVRVGRWPSNLCEEQILAWADAYFAAHGKWPTALSGPILGTRETWGAVARAVEVGGRGFRSRSSLAQLLAQRRLVRNHMRLPPLTEEQILAWADACFASQGKWPSAASGPIPGSGETWLGVHSALNGGGRGLRGGSSLAQLLAQKRGVRNNKRLAPLTEKKILAWAKKHFQATGQWPNTHTKSITPSPGDTWLTFDKALTRGTRGLPGGSTLAKLLKKHGLK